MSKIKNLETASVSFSTKDHGLHGDSNPPPALEAQLVISSQGFKNLLHSPTTGSPASRKATVSQRINNAGGITSNGLFSMGDDEYGTGHFLSTCFFIAIATR